ncbi:MAG TPA: hypothetical protein VGC32_13465 [Solirubrobacterales bacterium]
MTVKLGLLARLEAKPGKGEALGEFLEAGRELALDRHLIRVPDRRDPLRDLASAPDIAPVDVLAVK